MRPRIIEDMDKWQILKDALIEKGYRLWQVQYDADEPEGYRAGFTTGGKNALVITHNKEIQKDIRKSFM